ncbi:MAG: hypothetical protein M3Q64_01300 [bacterium]|nr:hypothetical protein [bacterium]
MEAYAHEKVLFRLHDWFNPSFFMKECRSYNRRKRKVEILKTKIELQPHIKFNASW